MKHLESQLRPGSGIVLALYMAQHLVNHAFGIVSFDAATVGELDRLINEDTVAGCRYTDALMASTNSEKDWAR